MVENECDLVFVVFLKKMKGMYSSLFGISTAVSVEPLNSV